MYGLTNVGPVDGYVNEQIQSVDFDSQFHALSAPERRRLLYALWSHSDDQTPVDVRELTTDVDSDQSVSMHHVHLPKLVEMGLVRVDRDRQRVYRGEDFDEIEPLLGILAENADALPGDWP